MTRPTNRKPSGSAQGELRMKSSLNLKLMFNADDVNAALDAAWKDGLLCGPCMQKTERQDEMTQSDFCPACQAAVNSQLAPIVEHRFKEALVRMGLPTYSVEIEKN
jgi:hypothetical protein